MRMYFYSLIEFYYRSWILQHLILQLAQVVPAADHYLIV